MGETHLPSHFVDPETGFASLVDLLQTIFRTVKDAETNAVAGESLRGSGLVYAARATAAAADSANASADAADAASRVAESLTNNNGVASRAIGAAFQAAAAGYRADTAAHRAVAEPGSECRRGHLRARNLNMRLHIFTPQPESYVGDGVQEEEEVLGRIDDNTNDDCLTFPGKLNNSSIKPLIDPGGGCNLIKAEWLKTHGIEVDPGLPKFKSLLMADGSTSKKCPCIEIRWNFDGRKKVWTDVDFVVVEGYKCDALIGLPFLKQTETIHNCAGRLAFPECKGVHANWIRFLFTIFMLKLLTLQEY
ncbi:hypothetical protein TGAM01_v204219 [Trichoderma gamsii]|uniref:Uncharacterized protein n=1 Tax=Trichoderma gamsii TaxID=398673 RepID=A0A2P4ZQZ8_9HYPO|nr:hypothetical protein TGAM01_v204219 [Trichoderma gamsii]PON26718.1 hypothetical protein TGAM01_v204219 [Trichoderma gamsii]